MHGPVLSKLFRLFDLIAKEASQSEKTELYCDFVSRLYQCGGDLGKHLKREIMQSENVLIKETCAKRPVPDFIKAAAKNELSAFSDLSAIDINALRFAVSEEHADLLPNFCSKHYDFTELYKNRLAISDRTGYGAFSENAMFYFDGNGLCPYEFPDKTDINSLFGYDSQREIVMKNTLALARGEKAANILLCGDAGTGKSSTVKAVANALFKDGVRLCEIKKDQLEMLPRLVGILSKNPLKFIIFIDDLSFNKNDDSFGMLKAALEGSAFSRAQNTVIYATSNRRHLIKESFSDREGDDIHAADTAAELMSLSQRFSLNILFEKPSKALYLDIVQKICQIQNVPVSERLLLSAEQFALKKGGRSARAAEQFVGLYKILGEDF